MQFLQVDGKPVYQIVAESARALEYQWSDGPVVGATFPNEIAKVREIVGDMPLLIPGIGAQGGDIEATVKAGRTADGTGMMINSSRAILYASREKDFASAARASRSRRAIPSTATATAEGRGPAGAAQASLRTSSIRPRSCCSAWRRTWARSPRKPGFPRWW